MNHNMLCDWLGLPETRWPPSHYQLLDLPAGEADIDLIEQRVHDRLDALRCYQVTQPEEATEAMNRLAQALLCLTDPAEKEVYDSGLGITTVPIPPPIRRHRLLPPPLPPPLPANLPNPVDQPALVTIETASVLLASRDPLAWMYARASSLPLHSTPPPLPMLPQTLPRAEKPSRSLPALASPPAERVDPVVEAVRSSEARSDLGTLGGVRRRARLTRRLILAWEALGELVEDPRRKLKLPEEEKVLTQRFRMVRQLLRRFPSLLGAAGQPGHLISSLADQEVVPTFQDLNRGQRFALSRDWQAGQKLLVLYRAFLLDEFREIRQLSFSQRCRRVVRIFFTDHPVVGAVVLGLGALNLVLWAWLKLSHWWGF